MTTKFDYSKKLLAKVDQINERLGTNYELKMAMFEYVPKHIQNPLPVIKTGSVRIGKYTLWNYKQLKRYNCKIFGMTFGKFYMGIHFGKSTYHVNIPKVHTKPCIQAKYYIEGTESEDGYTRKEMNMFLEKLLGYQY